MSPKQPCHEFVVLAHLGDQAKCTNNIKTTKKKQRYGVRTSLNNIYMTSLYENNMQNGDLLSAPAVNPSPVRFGLRTEDG